MHPVILIIVGFVPVGIMAFAICFELYKNYRIKTSFSELASAPGNLSPRKVSNLMILLIRNGYFRKHILKNNAVPFNDAEYLRGYKSHIRNPLVITHISNLKGGFEYE